MQVSQIDEELNVVPVVCVCATDMEADISFPGK